MKGFALGLGPGLAPVGSLALGLSLRLRGAGRRGGGALPFGRRCRHGRTLHKRRGEGIGGHAPRRCAGEAAVTNHQSLWQTGTTRSREGVPWIGVTSDEAENAPRLRVTYGEDSKESK